MHQVLRMFIQYIKLTLGEPYDVHACNMSIVGCIKQNPRGHNASDQR